MKKNISYLLAFLFIIIVSDGVMAQVHKNCGMSHDDLAEVKRQMLENRRELANFVPSRNAVTYVPVRWHLVADASGEGRANERSALQALCNLNTNYEDQEVQFYTLEFNYLNNTTIYNNPDGFSGGLNISTNMTYDAVNVFVVGADLGGGGGGGIVQAYYQPPAGPGGADWIVCNKSFLTDTYVLTHEMGHFLSLPHPFSGWDNEPWDPSDHGNPVMMSTSPGGEPVELVDGSNCNTAGDGFCDTPADYNFGITFSNGNCNYNGNCMDANGDLLVPLKENVMNYFGCNTQTFTDDQKAAVQNSLNSSNRNYCTPNYTPNTDIIEGNTSLVYPGNLQTAPNYNSVTLEWEAKDGATHYAVEISGAQILTAVSETNSLLLTNLEPNSTYLWRVTPFNESYGCANSSSQQLFKTGDNMVATNEVAEIEDWTVAPNPVSTSQSLRISINAAETFEANVSLVDLTGKVVYTIENQSFSVGDATLEMNINDLPVGLYSVVIRSEKGVSNKRVVVTK